MKKLLIVLVVLTFPFLLMAQIELKVMSYNIRLDVKSDGENWWEYRKDKVAGLMIYNEPDFIGMQEVTHPQLRYLQQELAQYNYIGVGRDDGKEAGEYSCIFYKKKNYELIKQSTFWLSPNPNIPSKGWDAALNRICTYGLFKHKKSKKLIWVFNTHFDHIGKLARLESAKLIVSKIKELNTANYPIILTGDFNSKPDEEPAQYMRQQMQDSRTISPFVYGPADTWNAFQFNKKPEGRIDYIFISHHHQMKVSKFATLTDSYGMKYPSDHFPIIVAIIIAK